MKEKYELIKLAMPIILYEFFTIVLSNIDSLMVGQLGVNSIVAINIAEQIKLIIMCLLFGVANGTSIFFSQFWGKRDKKNMAVVLNLCLVINLCIGLFFIFISYNFGELFFSLYTKDKEIMNIGSEYLKIVVISYMFTAASVTFSALLRSIKNTKAPAIIGGICVIVNTVGNFVLINGILFFPKMGVKGLAIATVAARMLELIAYIAIVLKTVDFTRFQLKNQVVKSKRLIRRYFRVIVPEILGGIVWIVGIAVYNILYANLGKNSFAAMNIASVIEGFAFFVFVGISRSSAIIIGNKIGESKSGEVYEDGKWFIKITGLLGIVIGALLFTVGYFIIDLYNVDILIKTHARYILLFFSAILWIKVINKVLIEGMLGSGGDTKYLFVISTISMWCIGVPLLFFATNIMKFPIYIVILFTLGEEVAKLGFCVYRFISKKWINDITANNEVNSVLQKEVSNE